MTGYFGCHCHTGIYLLLCFFEVWVPIKKLRESAHTKAWTAHVTSRAAATFLWAITEKLNFELMAEFFSEQ